MRPVYTLNTERVYLYTGKNLKKTLRLDQFLRQVKYLIHIYTELMDIEEQRQETSSLVHMKDVSNGGLAW